MNYLNSDVRSNRTSLAFNTVGTSACSLLAVVFCLPDVASAVTTYVGAAYEGFNYSAGALPTSSPTTATGFNDTGNPSLANSGTATWIVSASPTTTIILGSSLSYSATGYAAPTVGSVSLAGAPLANTAAQDSLTFAQSVDSGTLWFSFLMASTAITNRTLDFGLKTALGTSQPTIGRSNSATAPSGVISLNYGGTITPASGISMGDTTHLIIGRLVFDDSATDVDRISIYVDPLDVNNIDLGTPYTSSTANIGTVTGFQLRALGLNAGVSAAAGTFDEIRFGTTLASVTVPEPASSGLACVGALSLLCLRRRRRAE